MQIIYVDIYLNEGPSSNLFHVMVGLFTPETSFREPLLNITTHDENKHNFSLDTKKRQRIKRVLAVLNNLKRLEKRAAAL